MSAIARYLKQIGNNILGYDRTPTALTEELVAEGMDIKYEDDPSHIANRHIDMVIYTPAIGDDNRILQYARENALVVKKRSEVLGLITNQKKTIAVAGTHGKTTTSGMIAHILTKSNIGCSAFLGGISNNYHTNCLINPDSDYVVVEADEYDRSFLQLSPYMSVITSVEADHLDIYGTLSEVEKAFACFADKTDKSGKLFVKDTLCERIDFKHKSVSYSLLEQTDCHAANIRVSSCESVMPSSSASVNFFCTCARASCDMFQSLIVLMTSSLAFCCAANRIFCCLVRRSLICCCTPCFCW